MIILIGGKYTSTYVNMRAVSYLLDTNVWSVYAGDNAEYAIGGPTIELLFKSINEKNRTNYVAQATSEIGYEIGDGTVTDSGRLNLVKVGIPYIVENNSDYSSTKANETWIASPSAFDYYGGCLFAINDLGATGTIFCEDYEYGTYNSGIRPVVCLNADTKLQDNGDGTYTIL